MPNVVIATTMWRRVWGTEGEDREARLKSAYWANIIAQGCKVERFQDTYESAWHIIGHERKMVEEQAVKESDEREAEGNEIRQTKKSVCATSTLISMDLCSLV